MSNVAQSQGLEVVPEHKGKGDGPAESPHGQELLPALGAAAEDSCTQEDGRATVMGPQLTVPMWTGQWGLLGKLILDPPSWAPLVTSAASPRMYSLKAHLGGLSSW